MRYLFTILCCLFVVTITAQQTTHIVGKGETPVTIAEKYQITVEELKQSNPLVKNFYVGMKINLPAKAKRLLEVSSNNYTSQTPTRVASAFIRHAERHLANDEYKKAIKELNQSIEEQPSFQAYWLRGLSYYNLGKWDKAMADLRAVIVDEAGNNSIRTEAERLYANASQNLQEKREKRNQFWGEILATVGLVAVQAGQQALYNESMKSSGSLFNNDGSINEAEYNKMLQRCYVNAQIQTQQEAQAEFNQFNALHKQMYGKEATWEDFTSYKAQSANASSNTNGFNSTSTGLDMNNSGSSSTYEPSFVKESKTCNYCKGTGINPGKDYVARFGSSTKVRCSTCGDIDFPHYHEKCPSCGGKGYTESMKRK